MFETAIPIFVGLVLICAMLFAFFMAMNEDEEDESLDKIEKDAYSSAALDRIYKDGAAVDGHSWYSAERIAESRETLRKLQYVYRAVPDVHYREALVGWLDYYHRRLDQKVKENEIQRRISKLDGQ